MASKLIPKPPPTTTLAPALRGLLHRHRILSPQAAVRVSPICLGAMNFGTAYEGFMGECTQETAFKMLDYFWSQGGNFVDTAVNYQDGVSEEWVGQWMKQRGRRDEMVLATKFTGGFMTNHGDKVLQSNFGGNSAKSIRLSVEKSLRTLQTDYIDLVSLRAFRVFTCIGEDRF